LPDWGEFLHGLFSFAGTVINEVDIANVGTLSQQLDQATLNYYGQFDPPSAANPNGERFTREAFKAKNGFNVAQPGFQLCAGNVCDNPDQEVNVVFANSGDLRFGRDMHCRRTNTGGATGFDYACFVSNYGDITTDDTQDATNARNSVLSHQHSRTYCHRGHGVLSHTAHRCAERPPGEVLCVRRGRHTHQQCRPRHGA
jgi:hypothetical protein